jgi:hypothetical protein
VFDGQGAHRFSSPFTLKSGTKMAQQSGRLKFGQHILYALNLIARTGDGIRHRQNQRVVVTASPVSHEARQDLRESLDIQAQAFGVVCSSIVHACA